MKYLIVLSGIPGSGKSYFVRQHGLEPYTLSPDDIRLRFNAPDLGADGRLGIVQSRGVFEEMHRMMDERMKRGEYIVLDATHTMPRYFKTYQQIAHQNQYKLVVVDFSDVSLETCLERNIQRPEYKIVPENIVKRFHKQISALEIPSKIEIIKPNEYEDLHQRTSEDFSRYTKIHHIGDIQGVFTPVQEYFDTYGIHDDQAYIFIGDLVDRGKENDKVVQLMIELLKKPNVYLIQGNHDSYLKTWANGKIVTNREFSFRTQPQLEAAGINQKELKSLLYRMRPYLYYSFQDKEVLVTHGGLSKIPEHLHFISEYRCIHGAGSYKDVYRSADSFLRNTQDHQYLIHGHRNPLRKPLQYNSRVFNLEGRIEFGGALRTVTLDDSGFTPIEISARKEARPTLSFPENSDFLSQLRDSPLVQEKHMGGTFDSIASFNFTKDAFHSKSWDEQSITARGLFANTQTQEIVIRSYNKFFNVGERPETQLRNLEQTSAYPIKVWYKENGYLGLLGYDSEMERLVFASKSTTDSIFARWFEDQFYDAMSSKSIRSITELLASQNLTMVFEVIDPINDPHIITEEKPRIVLLDMIRRTPGFSKLPDDEVRGVAKKYNLEYKELITEIEDAHAYSEWYNQVSAHNYTYNNKYLEGFVLEDADGQMVKLKLHYYLFWRRMRTLMQNIYKGKTAFKHDQTGDPELSRAFGNFIIQKKEAGQYFSNIVEARALFEKE